MGLTWKHGPLGSQPAGRFLTNEQPPRHVLYLEPAGRRMRLELAGHVIAQSDRVMLLHETGHYPVAYFPSGDVDTLLLEPSAKKTDHQELGEGFWWSLTIEGKTWPDVAWAHPSPPEPAEALAGLIAFDWSAMDRVFEEDEQIFGHAADGYHRVDIRASSRRVTVRLGENLVAETDRPLAVFETGFPVRWYLPPQGVRPGALQPNSDRTFCPYKGEAEYFDVRLGDDHVRMAAWTYPDAVPEAARLAGYLSFDPQTLEITVDGQLLREGSIESALPHAWRHLFVLSDKRS